MKRSHLLIKLNFLKVALLAFFVTSCSYGDDISSLRDRVSNLEDAVSNLQAAFDQGKVITSVKALNEGTGGYLVSFSDGTSLSLINGADGKDGLNGHDGKMVPTVKMVQTARPPCLKLTRKVIGLSPTTTAIHMPVYWIIQEIPFLQ